ncbi:hypothetical protein [Akkermansia sp.]|uniref:hypothetical protein n=1 Tax=Akkermansia sp. TaxID=1872421 RepID=UPI0025BDB0C8|nr:hypothetical protein [Akkermansia sp.]MCC8148760.1 hypothetical protein [Akkermansia sp.]
MSEDVENNDFSGFVYFMITSLAFATTGVIGNFIANHNGSTGVIIFGCILLGLILTLTVIKFKAEGSKNANSEVQRKKTHTLKYGIFAFIGVFISLIICYTNASETEAKKLREAAEQESFARLAAENQRLAAKKVAAEEKLVERNSSRLNGDGHTWNSASPEEKTEIAKALEVVYRNLYSDNEQTPSYTEYYKLCDKEYKTTDENRLNKKIKDIVFIYINGTGTDGNGYIWNNYSYKEKIAIAKRFHVDLKENLEWRGLTPMTSKDYYNILEEKYKTTDKNTLRRKMLNVIWSRIIAIEQEKRRRDAERRERNRRDAEIFEKTYGHYYR